MQRCARPGIIEGWSRELDRVLAILNGVGQLLPVTVIGAIILFIIKELLEAKRREKANARKRRAVRRLIADEIERNNWTIGRLRDGISTIETAMEISGFNLSIRTGTHGERYLRSELSGKLHSESLIGRVHSEALSSNLLELAIIDEHIFDEALEASDATKELDHVLKLMIEEVSNKDHFMQLVGLADFAKAEIADCERTLSNFYGSITGRNLEGRRIR